MTAAKGNEKTIPRKGRRVLAGWGLLAGALAALGLAAAGAGAAAGGLAAGAGVWAGVWLWCWSARFGAALAAGRVQVRTGRFFGGLRRNPCACVRGALLLTTPLLRRADCCVLLLFVPGRPLVLPALERGEAAALAAAALGPAAPQNRP